MELMITLNFFAANILTAIFSVIVCIYLKIQIKKFEKRQAERFSEMLYIIDKKL